LNTDLELLTIAPNKPAVFFTALTLNWQSLLPVSNQYLEMINKIVALRLAIGREQSNCFHFDILAIKINVRTNEQT